MSDVEQWEHDEQLAMENEIISLREQVERLTKERDIKEHCIVQFESEHLLLKEQLAALAEQNKLLRSFAHERHDALLDQFVTAMPDLASPVLNRIRAEGMRMAAEILIDPMDRAAAQKICAQADELENEDAN